MNKSRSIVVDAGPLIAIAKLNRLVLFSDLFKEVIVPQAVVAECTVDLSRMDAQRIREAIGHGPFLVVSVEESPRLQTYRQLLDPGEAHALLLAEQRHLPVLMDERRGRREARRMGIELIGTGALLVAAKRRGLVSEVRPLLDALIHQGYRLSKGLQQNLLEMSGES